MLQYNLRSAEDHLLGRPGQDGFEEMYRAYRRRVRGLCRTLLRDSTDPEDASQEVMLRALRAWPRFEYGRPVWPWLSTITANVCRDAARRAQVAMRATGYTVGDTAPQGLDEDGAPIEIVPDAYDDAARNTRTDLVREALEAVPTAYRTSLYLREIEGWSLPDIAKARGRSVASVRSTLTRGRRLLATQVELLARSRHQWPLPAVVLGGARRIRTRLTKMRDGITEASVSVWARMDAAFSVLTTIRGGMIAPTIATVAAVAIFVGSSTPPARISARLPEAASTLDANNVPATTAPQSIEPSNPPPRTGATGGASRADAYVRVGEASLPHGRSTWTATPSVEAAPGPAPAAGEAAPREINVGPISVNCGAPDERALIVGTACSGLETVGATR